LSSVKPNLKLNFHCYFSLIIWGSSHKKQRSTDCDRILLSDLELATWLKILEKPLKCSPEQLSNTFSVSAAGLYRGLGYDPVKTADLWTLICHCSTPIESPPYLWDPYSSKNHSLWSCRGCYLETGALGPAGAVEPAITLPEREDKGSATPDYKDPSA